MHDASSSALFLLSFPVSSACFPLFLDEETDLIESHWQTTIKVLATPLRNSQQPTLSSPDDDTKKKKKDKSSSSAKKSKREKFEKLEALSQRLRLCILKRVNHRRHCSS